MSDFQVWAFYWVATVLQLFMAGGIVWLARDCRPQTLVEEFGLEGDWSLAAAPADRDRGPDDLHG